MPVKRRTIGAGSQPAPAGLVDELERELRSDRQFGQPLVELDTYPRTNVVLVTVTWDKFTGLSEAQRSAAVREAYTRVFGEPAPDHTVFAVGFTWQEAADAGRLPYAIIPTLRRSDPVTPERVREVMAALGAAPNTRGDIPAVLRFPSLDDAETCRQELIRQIPGSDAIWSITQEVQRPEWAVS